MSKRLHVLILVALVAGNFLAAAQSNPFGSSSGAAAAAQANPFGSGSGGAANPFGTASGEEKAASTPPVNKAASASPAPPPVQVQEAEPVRKLAEEKVDPAKKLAEEKAKKQYALNEEFNAACVGGNVTQIDSLLKSRAEIDNTIHSWTQLAVASMGETANNLAVGSYLLQNRADPDAADNRGRTPLYFAVKHNYSSLVKEMLVTAKDLETHDGNGVQALTRAVWMGFGPIVKDLIKAGHPLEQGMSAAGGDDVAWSIKQMFNLTTTTTTTTTTAKPTTTVRAYTYTPDSSSLGKTGDL